MGLEIKGQLGSEIVIGEDNDFMAIESPMECYASVSFDEFTPKQIARLVHELSDLAWISVDNELPEEAGWYQTKGCKDAMQYFNGELAFTKATTHWQPLAKAG